jgi:hypothetical protein
MKRKLLVGLAAILIVGLRTSAAPRTISRITDHLVSSCVSAPCDNTFAYPIEQSPTIDVEGQMHRPLDEPRGHGLGRDGIDSLGRDLVGNHKIKVRSVRTPTRACA